jgi:septal ring factor EnvC (AmiA/AmiB activator)
VSTSGAFRIVGIGVVLASGMVVALAGQGSSAQTGSASSDGQLLAEVRALRAELDEVARASMRAQILGMRLQLQEQRIAGLGRQLNDVQEKVRANERARAPMTAGLKMLNAQVKDANDAGEVDHIVQPLKAQVDALDRDDQQLKGQEAEILRLLSEEQSRWSSFNAQIEELERAMRGKMR